MLRSYRSKRLALITFVYWFLLLYIVAALAWWYIELWQMNEAMFVNAKEMLSPSSHSYANDLAGLLKERSRKNGQFLGEGITFLGVMILAAVFVYRSVRHQIKLSAQQNNFMMAVTHELKTPISVTKLNLETLRKHKLDPEQTGKIISNTLQETNRLNDLCNNILLSSQLEAGAFQLFNEEINLSALLEEMVSEFRERFPKRAIEIRPEANPVISGDKLLLRLAFNNLLENALKYSPATEPIVISIGTSSTLYTVSFSDHGAGIPDTEKKKVFEKFYRIGDEITRHTKGTGLGLFLTKKIITDHKGTIRLQNNTPTGSVFLIELPKTM
jgi:two-component system, OmpR family, sensor histidine kinase CiaH